MSNYKNLQDKRYWFNDAGHLHRDDGPALETVDGYKAWWVNGKRHRLDGPAIEYHTGAKEWWINGVNYSSQEFPSVVVMFLLNVNKETICVIKELFNDI